VLDPVLVIVMLVTRAGSSRNRLLAIPHVHSVSVAIQACKN
jgi:hypothetical protein